MRIHVQIECCRITVEIVVTPVNLVQTSLQLKVVNVNELQLEGVEFPTSQTTPVMDEPQTKQVNSNKVRE